VRDFEDATGGLKLKLLRERHQNLDDEIDKANERRWMSTAEQVRIKALKVKRLRLKDLISEMEEEDGS
jgi:uncharacterized protein YdcH (DUF465 family)